MRQNEILELYLHAHTRSSTSHQRALQQNTTSVSPCLGELLFSMLNLSEDAIDFFLIG